MVNPSLIEDCLGKFREATRRPLFHELVKSKEQRDEKEESWIQLVQDAVAIYPYMSMEQRGQVWRLSAILVLAFMIPLSTGNESVFSSSDDVVDVDLEERLACVAHVKQVCRNGILMHPYILQGWHDFVQQALTPLLSQRPPVDTDEAADLLHMLALCITPRVNRLELNVPAHYHPSQQQHLYHPIVERLYRLATCPTAAYFYLQDGQRDELVQMLYQYWPILYQAQQGVEDDPSLAWQCGAAHLRASLGAWARRHYTPYQVWALAARLDSSWARAWNTALHQLVGEDRMDYHGSSIDIKKCESESWTRQRIAVYWKPGDPRPLLFPGCPHIQRGFVLATLLLDSCGHPDHASHMATALTELGDALEWVLDAWTVDDENKVPPVTCLAAVLLGTTSILFQLVDVKATLEQFQEVYENILHSSIQFLRHTDASIRFGAFHVLEHAWNTLGLPSIPFASVLLTTLQQTKSPGQRNEWKHVVGMLSRTSAPFAKELAKTWQGELLPEHALVSVVATNQPGTFSVSDLTKALDDATGEQVLSMAASLISTRQSYYFDETQATWGRLSKSLENAVPWDQYCMSIFALTNGEYDTATRLFQVLSRRVSDKKYYLWIQTLNKVAQAECILSKQAALGIPSAGVLLHDATAYLDGLQTRHHEEDYSFQIRFLLLRLDILDLVTVLRQILREMRLTGQLPSKGTRTFSHIPSIFRSFLKLAKQFMSLNQRFGLLWQSRRTSACLASFRDLAFFLAQTTLAAFGPILPAALTKLVIPDLSSNLLFPMNELLRELEKLVIQPFIKSGGAVDPKTISTALLQVIDGILMVPLPWPRDFCAPLPVLEIEWKLRPDALHVAEMKQSSFDLVESFPSLSPTVCIEGQLSNAVKLRRPVRAMHLSYRIRHIGPLEEEGGSKDIILLPPISKTTSLAIDRQGQFSLSFTLPPLLEEGWFEAETFLKCQAVDGKVYDVAVSKTTSARIKIRNSRSR